jgi:NADH:ubiquinone oxidoreductase subunit E
MSSTTDNWQEVEATAKRVLGERIVQFIDQCRAQSEPESQLIAVLHKVQADYGYLAEAHLDAVAQLMQVPAAKVAGVAGFYHYFRLQQRGRFLINVCLGTACYVKGADRVAAKLMEELGIKFGETSTDGIFTLEAARCLGTCGIAPVMMIGDQVHPEVTPDQIPAILEKYLEKARKEGHNAEVATHVEALPAKPAVPVK